MKGKKNQKPTTHLIMLVLLSFVFSAALFVFVYRVDNKYTYNGQRPERGMLLLSEHDLNNNPIVYLTSGWEIYRGKLLSPEDFESSFNLPDEYVFLGQYGGLEGRTGSNLGPHGSATYRLNISLPQNAKNYTLELPEIYSAYKLYINGELEGQMGEPGTKNYRVETGNSKVSIRCKNSMEIILAVSDYSHFYSGMVYPPAFGISPNVEKLLNVRFGLRFAVIAVAICMGLLCLCIWLMLKKNDKNTGTLPLSYAVLCLCFALYISYPVVKTLTTTGVIWYAIENTTLPSMLLIITIIQSRIANISHLPKKIMISLGIFVCAWSFAAPSLISSSLNLIMAHSNVLLSYTWIVAFFLLISSIYSVYEKNTHSTTLLASAVVFGTSLVMDRIFPLFEPIRFGWFSEIAGLFFVLSIGGVMANEVAAQFRLRLQLEGRVDIVTHMMEVQRSYYPEIQKKEEELRSAQHDFRHHMVVIREITSAGDLSKLKNYVESFDDRVSFQAQSFFCKHYVVNMLLRMYASLASSQNTLFVVEALLPDTLPFDDIDLCVMLSNLLENALEASLKIPIESRRITVRIRCKMNHFGVSIDNAFDGVIEKNNGRFLSQKATGRMGIGLVSVNSVCARYGGDAKFSVEKNNFFHCEILLPLSHKEGRKL